MTYIDKSIAPAGSNQYLTLSPSRAMLRPSAFVSTCSPDIQDKDYSVARCTSTEANTPKIADIVAVVLSVCSESGTAQRAAEEPESELGDDDGHHDADDKPERVKLVFAFGFQLA